MASQMQRANDGGGQLESRLVNVYAPFETKLLVGIWRLLDSARDPYSIHEGWQPNWLFAGTLLAGQRAAAITSLIQSAKLNGHDPNAYLKEVVTRLPTQKARDIDELLPHFWRPTDATA